MEIFNYLRIVSNNDHAYDDNHDKKNIFGHFITTSA